MGRFWPIPRITYCFLPTPRTPIPASRNPPRIPLERRSTRFDPHQKVGFFCQTSWLVLQAKLTTTYLLIIMYFIAPTFFGQVAWVDSLGGFSFLACLSTCFWACGTSHFVKRTLQKGQWALDQGEGGGIWGTFGACGVRSFVSRPCGVLPKTTFMNECPETFTSICPELG